MPSTLIVNAVVWTGHRLPSGEVFTTDAVLMRGDRVVALGESARRGAADEVVDAHGGFVCSAFSDGHVHPVFAGLEEQFAPVRDAGGPHDIARAVGDWARAHPDAEWVRGEGFDPTVAASGLFLAEWLDAEVAERPVVLRASDYHTVWVNSEALRRIGYGIGVAQPHDGEIVLLDGGVPAGTLREWGAWRPVYDLMPQPSLESRISAVATATQALASGGIAWAQDAWVEAGDIETWIAAYERGAIHVDVDLALWADPNSWRTQPFADLRSRVPGGALTCNTVKFFADGVIESGTGALLSPYCDCPHSVGLPNWDTDELKAAVAAVDALHFNAHIHAIGDRGVRMALDAMEFAASVNPSRDRRWVIAHTQLVDAGDLRRFAELGVVANFEPYWSKFDSWQEELTAPRLGAERTERQYQTATLANLGAVISFGSDWPVTTYEPLKGIQVAVTRQESSTSEPWVPQERLTVEQALMAYTAGVAHQAGRDDAGVIRAGARADLVLLDADPRAVDPLVIGDIAVRRTWRRGSTTFAAG